jgi:predicted SnoaL-like aldol condensation-catalyzing enzyme
MTPLSKKGWRATEMKKAISLSIFLLVTTAVAIVTTGVIISQIIPAASTTTTTTQQQAAAQHNSLEEGNNKILVRSAIQEIFNEHNITAIDKYIKEDLIQNNTGFPEGREARKQFFGMLFNAFPDLEASIDKTVAEDDHVVVFLSWNGTHTGEFQSMPATNNPITMKTAHIFRIEDGMIAEQWETSDTLDLLEKTGVIAFGQQR